MMRAIVTVFALLAATAVFAQSGPGSFARMTSPRGGQVFLDLSYVASDACQAILSIRRGAPGGASVGLRNVPVTAVVGPDPQGCGNSRVVRRTSRVTGGLEPDLVEIFFISTGGRLLKHEKVAIEKY